MDRFIPYWACCLRNFTSFGLFLWFYILFSFFFFRFVHHSLSSFIFRARGTSGCCCFLSFLLPEISPFRSALIDHFFHSISYQSPPLPASVVDSIDSIPLSVRITPREGAELPSPLPLPGQWYTIHTYLSGRYRISVVRSVSFGVWRACVCCFRFVLFVLCLIVTTLNEWTVFWVFNYIWCRIRRTPK